MSGFLQPRLCLTLCSALAALAGWLLLPGTAIDRAFFKLIGHCVTSSPFFISGNGSFTKPWQIRSLARTQKPNPRHVPRVVSLRDDTDAFFQSSPPSPIDMAVIFKNLQRLGANKTASAAVLTWDAPDPIGLTALDRVLDRFDSLVMAAPVTRGAVAEPMPEAFRNASISLKHVQGDISTLPVVNSIPLSGVILGRKNTQAGFQSIAYEEVSIYPSLLARWEDRVIFAFPLLVTMQHLKLPLDGIEIHAGKFIKLSPQGPVVPIDRFGRMSIAPENLANHATLPAELLIDSGEDLFPKEKNQLVILRDDRSNAEPVTKHFSKQFCGTIAIIASDTCLTPAWTFKRLKFYQECILLIACITSIWFISGMTAFSSRLAYGALFAIVIAVHLIAALNDYWLPSLAAFAAIVDAFVISRIRGFSR